MILVSVDDHVVEPVSALRAESPDVDLGLRSQGGKPPTEEVRPVTTRDVTMQLASAFTEAPE
jgi:hypothetical protein